MGFGEVAMAALYFVLRFGLAFSDRLGGERQERQIAYAHVFVF